MAPNRCGRRRSALAAVLVCLSGGCAVVSEWADEDAKKDVDTRFSASLSLAKSGGHPSDTYPSGAYPAAADDLHAPRLEDYGEAAMGAMPAIASREPAAANRLPPGPEPFPQVGPGGPDLVAADIGSPEAADRPAETSERDTSGRSAASVMQRLSEMLHVGDSDAGASQPRDVSRPGNAPSEAGGNAARAAPPTDEGTTSETSGAELIPTPSAFEPITLHTDDVDVRKVLEMLSRQGGVNILVSPGVKGNVTVHLEKVSFDEALRAILKLCNLVAHREKGLTFVYTAQELPRLDRDLQVFPLDYVSATDVLTTVTGLLSAAGSAYVSESSDKDNRKTQEVIVVEDSSEYLARIGRYIAQIDQPPRQVLIEAHILEVLLEDECAHGVNFDHTMNVLGNVAKLQVKGFANPAAATAFFAKVDGSNLEALVEALKSTMDAKTLAAPRVLALNGQESRIQIGQRLGYRVTTTTETTTMESVEFLDTGVVLHVTPRISWDHRIIMHVKPQVSSGKIVDGLPEEDTTEVDTDVSLRDGEGMVVGGLIREKDHVLENKIPLLGDLWVVGTLFQYRKIEKQKAEVIIVLIPRVVPYAPPDAIRDRAETCAATTPLLYGPLRRYPRPWDARLRDALHGPRYGRPPHVYCDTPPMRCPPQFEAVGEPGTSEMPDLGR